MANVLVGVGVEVGATVGVNVGVGVDVSVGSTLGSTVGVAAGAVGEGGATAIWSGCPEMSIDWIASEMRPRSSGLDETTAPTEMRMTNMRMQPQPHPAPLFFSCLFTGGSRGE